MVHMLKRHSSAAKLAWCPSATHKNLLVSGNTFGTIDERSFETKSNLEILDLNLMDFDDNFKVVGSLSVKDTFSSIDWGMKGFSDPSNASLSNGIIAGGMFDGAINLWSASSILSKSSSPLLTRAEVHKAAVLALDFHPIPEHQHLLASGSADGEVYVWHLGNVAEPKLSSRPTATQTSKSPVHCVQWNRTAFQILASVSEQGESSIWDLRKKRAVVSVKPSSRANLKPSAFKWSKDFEFAVSYYGSGVVEVWDMRKPVVPKARLNTGATNVHGVDWNPFDSSLLLSVDDLGQSIVWDTNTDTMVSKDSIARGAYDPAWSPDIQDVYSTSCFDGFVEVSKVSRPLNRSPATERNYTSISFGFGGKVVTAGRDNIVTNTQPAKEAPHTPTTPQGEAVTTSSSTAATPAVVTVTNKRPHVCISQLDSDHVLIENAQAFEPILASQSFHEFCRQKADQASQRGFSGEARQWRVLQLVLEGGDRYTDKLLIELGFDRSKISKSDADTDNEPSTTNTFDDSPDFQDDISNNLLDDLSNPSAGVSADASSPGSSSSSSSSASSIISPLSAKSAPGPESLSVKSAVPAHTPKFVNSAPIDTAYDDEIRRAIVVADFTTAVTLCLKANRFADAIMLAANGGAELWSYVQGQYLSSHRQPFFSSVAFPALRGDLPSMVQNSDLGAWDTTLAMILCWGGENMTSLASLLLSRMQTELVINSEATALPALIVSIVKGDLAYAIYLWSTVNALHAPLPSTNTSPEECKESDTVPGQHCTLEKASVLYAALRQRDNTETDRLVQLYSDYAMLLANQGATATACSYVYLLANLTQSVSPATAVLCDRVVRSQPPHIQHHYGALLSQPLPTLNVGTDPTLSSRRQKSANDREQARAALVAPQPQPTQQHMYPGQGSYNQPPYNPYGAPPSAPAPVPTSNQPPAPVPPAAPANPYQPHPPQHQAPTGYNPSVYPTSQPQHQPQQPQHQPQQHQQPQQPQYTHQQPQQSQPPQYSHQPQPAASRPAPTPSYTPGTGAYSQPSTGAYNQPSINNSYNPPQPATTTRPAPSAYNPPTLSSGTGSYHQSSTGSYNQPSTGAYNFPAPTSTLVSAPPVPEPVPAPVAYTPTEADEAIISFFEQYINNLETACANSPDQRLFARIKKNMEELYALVRTGKLSCLNELNQLAQIMCSSDMNAAVSAQQHMINHHFEGNQNWLSALRSVLTIAKKFIPQ